MTPRSGPAHPGRGTPARFIDPAVLARIGNLELLARVVVDGFVAGLHQAAHLGVSTDFAEHRAYVPGDDVRTVDWRLFGRTDRLYVKTFEAETTADVCLALDVSASMDFGGAAADAGGARPPGAAGLGKLDYARCLVASLAELAGRQRDRVGLATFDAAIRHHVAPSSGPRQALLHALAQAVAAGPGDLDAALARLAERLPRRGIVVVVSDFYGPPERIAAALDGLRVRGQDVIALHVVDRTERTLGLGGAVVLEDAETAERMPVVPERVAAEYRRLFAEHLHELAERCRGRGIDYAWFGTERPLDAALFRYLSGRARATRRRR